MLALQLVFVPLTLISLDLSWVWLNGRYGIYRFLNTPYSSLTPTIHLSTGPSMLCALLTWAAGALYIILLQSHCHDTAIDAFAHGCALGALVYVVFNTTAYLVFPLWREWLGWVPVALLDTCWGIILYGSVSAINRLCYGFQFCA